MLLRALVLVVIIRLGLWTVPFRIVRRAVDCVARANRPRVALPTSYVHKQMDVIRLVSYFVPGASCLTQAMAAQIILTRAGLTPLLRIGVLRADGLFKAHAWVEVEKKTVIGEVSGLEEFQMLPSLR